MLKKFILLASCALAITACQYSRHNGILLSENQIFDLKHKKLTKLQVEEQLGAPNIIPDYSKNTWYYIYRHILQRAFFNPKIDHQQIVKIDFKNEMVNQVEVLNDQQQTDLIISRDYTETQGTNLNPLQEYMRNFGRFNKSNKPASRR